MIRGYSKPKERDTMCFSRFTSAFPAIRLNFISCLQNIMLKHLKIAVGLWLNTRPPYLRETMHHLRALCSKIMV